MSRPRIILSISERCTGCGAPTLLCRFFCVGRDHLGLPNFLLGHDVWLDNVLARQVYEELPNGKKEIDLASMHLCTHCSWPVYSFGSFSSR